MSIPSNHNIQNEHENILSISELNLKQHDEDLEMLLIEPNINEKMVDYYCDTIFADAPIKFIPEKGNREDECISKLIRKYKITIPIIRIPDKDKIYLLGT